MKRFLDLCKEFIKLVSSCLILCLMMPIFLLLLVIFNFYFIGALIFYWFKNDTINETGTPCETTEDD